MTDETGQSDLRERVARQLALLNAHRVEEFLELCHDDITFTFPGTSVFGGTHVGKEAVERVFHHIFQVVPDLTFDHRHVLVGPDRAVVEWKDTGTTLTGAPFANEGVTILELEDGLLRRMRDHLDTERLASSMGSRRAAR